LYTRISGVEQQLKLFAPQLENIRQQLEPVQGKISELEFDEKVTIKSFIAKVDKQYLEHKDMIKKLNLKTEKIIDDFSQETSTINENHQALSMKVAEHSRKIASMKTEVTDNISKQLAATIQELKRTDASLSRNHKTLSETVENLSQSVDVIREKQSEPLPKPDLSNLPTLDDVEFLSNSFEDELDNITSKFNKMINELTIRSNLLTNKQLKDILAVQTREITDQLIAYDKKLQEQISELTGKFSERVFTPQPSVLKLKGEDPILPVVWDGGDGWYIQNPYLITEIKKAYDHLGVGDIRHYLQREAKV
jgi:hypothetical protein